MPWGRVFTVRKVFGCLASPNWRSDDRFRVYFRSWRGMGVQSERLCTTSEASGEGFVDANADFIQIVGRFVTGAERYAWQGGSVLPD